MFICVRVCGGVGIWLSVCVCVCGWVCVYENLGVNMCVYKFFCV